VPFDPLLLFSFAFTTVVVDVEVLALVVVRKA
jgi:hypothetical protein